MPDRERGGGPGGVREPDPERGAVDPGRARGRERGPDAGRQPDIRRERQAVDRERQQADRERQALDREQQKVDREQQRLDRARQQADRLQQRLGREQQKADRERQRLSGAHQQAGRGRGAHDRPGPDENGADNLWPPFGPESDSDRSTQADRLMRKQAERDPRGRGRLA
ncbi:MAG TPA: hypothetical protein VGJ50_35615, partial [Streptosporangiaceae bacterium]